MFSGVVLAPYGREHHVSRAAVLSIVLTLAVGPNATLLCRTWCDRQAAAASGCHHEAPTISPRVGDESCDDMALSAAAFLREEVRRPVSAPDAAHAVLVPRYRLAQSTIDASRRHEPGREWPLEERPLPFVLRI